MSETRPGKSLWSRWLDDLLALGILSVLAGTLFSLLGRFWWVADLASHFAVYYTLAGGGLLIVALLMRRRVRTGLALLILIINGLFIWPTFAPTTTPVPSGSAVLKLAQVNVWHRNRDRGRVVDLIRNCNADIVFVQEVDAWWDNVLREEDTKYRVAASQPGEGSFGLAMLIRDDAGLQNIELESTQIFDFASDSDDAQRPSIEATLLLNGRRVTLLSIHPPPPVSSELTELRDSILKKAKGWASQQTEPHIVIGDLNTTPWSYAFSILTGDGELISTLDGWGNQGTWPMARSMPWLLPIDHCLVSRKWVCIDRRIGQPTGSDHLPLLVSLAIPPTDQFDPDPPADSTAHNPGVE